MQRKPTKQSRGPNAGEKRFMAWTKEQPCIVCDHPGPSIGHHCMGSTFKVKWDYVTVLIGHAFILPLCQYHDDVITRESRRKFVKEFGLQSLLWMNSYTKWGGHFSVPIIMGISICGK